MRLAVPEAVTTVLRTLRAAGYEGYVVGGAVRDTLLQRAVVDWDFTTDARPEAIQALFPESFYENAFGTVGIAHEHLAAHFGLESELPSVKSVYEITTFRSDGVYSDHRRPESVTWGQSLHEDLERRDFTINALALEHVRDDEFRLHDPFGGKQDLEQRCIRAVGDPDTRFAEDALRMLRGVRLAAELQFSLDPQTLIAIQTHAGDIHHVSWERIRDEFLRILVTDTVEDALNVMRTLGLMQHILPELMATKGVDQRGHHVYDVWTHSLKACALCPSKDPVVRLAALVHDIAKPETQAPLPDKAGEYSFYNHEVIGARTARDIARRLRLSTHDIQRVFTLVRWHMFHYQPHMTDAAIRRFIRRVGVENMDDMIALRTGDRLGSGSAPTSWRLEEMKERIHAQLHQPMQLRDMVVDGNDVMTVLGIPPGPRIREVLEELFAYVLDDPGNNTREFLLPKLEGWRTRL